MNKPFCPCSGIHFLRYAGIRRSVFRTLFLFMILFGILVGILFPPFARLVLGSERALSPEFFALCIAAGFIVGLVNYILFDRVVSRELSRLVKSMFAIVTSVQDAEGQRGSQNQHHLDITSRDAIGDIQKAFNIMTGAIDQRLTMEGTLRGMNARLAACVELEEVAQNLLSCFANACAARAGLLYGNSGQNFTLLHSFGVDQNDSLPSSLDQSHGPVWHTLEKNQVVTYATEQGGMDWMTLSTPLGSFQPQRVLLIPLLVKQQPVGLVILACGHGSFSEEDRELLELLRGQAAPYLANAFLHQKVSDLAALDELTRILNRRFGLLRLKEEFSRATRHGVPLSVLMIDIDHFKQINDTFGHAAGDQILCTVAAELGCNLRSGDVLCRFGGDEFLIVTPGTGLADSARLGDRLRLQIARRRIERAGRTLSVTVSIGISTWPMVSAASPEGLVDSADLALYGAKELGRNCAAVWLNGKACPAQQMEVDY
jgi:diguanylate cyclase (GGDEF)-like protein